MKQSNFSTLAAEPEQDNFAGSQGRDGAHECGAPGLAAAICEIETLEAAAHADELLRRSASVAAAMMLQDTIVTVLTLMIELESLMPTPSNCSAFNELASQLASAAVSEAELSNIAMLGPVMGRA